jgi:hypothetical protein
VGVAVLLMAVNFWVRSYRSWLQEEEKKAAAGSTAQHVLLATEKTARYDLSCGERLNDYWSSIPDARQTKLTILSGMSQMHSINDPRPGDQLICQWLDDVLAAKGTRVWGFAAPNLCNEEAVFQMVSLVADPATRPNFFIYGICFDKMRNVDLRPGYEDFLRRRPPVSLAYEAAARRFAEKYPAASAKMLASLAALRQAPQQNDESFEARLRLQTEEFVPLVASRKDLNSQAQYKLFELRNKVLNITPTSKRPMIQSRFEMNWQFLQMLCDIGIESGVQMIFYIIPLNPQGDNPYIPVEYASFKDRCEKLCVDRRIPFANFETIVPAADWGFFMGGPDFKHFRGPGHKVTATAIVERFGPVLIGTGQTASGVQPSLGN